MKKYLIINIILLLTYPCFSQVIDFKEISFDLSKLDYKNEYKESKIDTIYEPSLNNYEIWSYDKCVYASKNNKYFLVTIDTMFIGASKCTGYDLPPSNYLSYYQYDSLLWRKNLRAGIRDVFFFENDEQLMISLGFFEIEGLFSFSKTGQEIDTISPANNIYRLDNDLLLINDYGSEYYALNDIDQISIIDSKGNYKLKDYIKKNNRNQRRIEVAKDGSKFSINSKDSAWVYDSNLNLLWKLGLKFKYGPRFMGAGDYIFIKERDSLRMTKPELKIYDSSNGNFVMQLDTIKYGDSSLTSLLPQPIRNSEYVYYRNIFWDLNKCDIIITDVFGKTLLYTKISLDYEPQYITYEQGFNLYRDNKIVKTIKY